MSSPEQDEPNANLAIWNTLSRTDPKHTKQFKRAGGFSGTALKPIWIIKMLTEQFGPAGVGWGMGQPDFRVVEGDGEVLVYCTVECWHGDRSNVFHGVGGDKVLTRRKDGSAFNDDEAFKKAFTDAIGNAFKFIGVGADVHMGLFEDSKYLAETDAEFRAAEQPEREKIKGIHAIKERLRALQTAGNEAKTLDDFNALVTAAKDDLTKIKDGNHEWWTGDGEDHEGFKSWIVRRRGELEPTMCDELIKGARECKDKHTLTKWTTDHMAMIDGLDEIDTARFNLAYDGHAATL